MRWMQQHTLVDCMRTDGRSRSEPEGVWSCRWGRLHLPRNKMVLVGEYCFLILPEQRQ